MPKMHFSWVQQNGTKQTKRIATWNSPLDLIPIPIRVAIFGRHQGCHSDAQKDLHPMKDADAPEWPNKEWTDNKLYNI